jgi:hypothetical protein
VYGLALCAALVLAEGAVRVFDLKPRMQLVRGHGLHTVDGVPVWSEGDDRENRGCAAQHPERTRILFFGSSITYGSGLRAAETLGPALEARLNQLRPAPGVCVMSFAQPGFSFEQKLATARVELARYRPALVMWEDWVEWYDYGIAGDTAFGTHGFRLRPDGLVGIAHVPDGANRLLFETSRLYQYADLAFGERSEPRSVEEEATEFAERRLDAVPRLAQSVDARLVLYLAPPLDRSFRDTDASPPPWHRVLLDFAGQRSVPAYTLQHELVGEDYRRLRRDDCCHYSAEGHAALARVMEKIVIERLDGAGVRL